MNCFWYRIAEKGPVRFLPFGDPHVQAKQDWTARKIRKYVQYAIEHRCYVIDVGDSLDFPTRDSKTSPLEGNQLSNQEAMEYLCDELYLPLLKERLLLGMVEGNHTRRAADRVGLLPGKIMADKLKVDYYGPGAIVKFLLPHPSAPNQRSFTIQVGHGTAGGGTLGNAVNRTQRESLEIVEGVDLVVQGHRHRSFVYPTTILYPNLKKPKLNARPRYLCNVPGFHPTQDGYADVKYAPTNHTHYMFTLEILDGGPQSTERKITWQPVDL